MSQKRVMVAIGLLVSLSMLLAACGAPAVETIIVEGTPMVITATPEPEEEPITNPLIGSGQLDGNGIPTDFFNDIHVRRGFNYCFDWNTYIEDVYQGEAVQVTGVILPGMLGYDPEGASYTFDLEKCGEELAQAWGGVLPEVGFRVQGAYNIGNTTRMTILQILAANLNLVSENYVMETVGLPWPAFLQAQRDERLPLFSSGWIEDIHDPHNWVVPYLTGTYAYRQNMPEEMHNQFIELQVAGIQASDPAERQTIYEELNQVVYENVPGIYLVVPLGRRYEQPYVEGWFYNPIWGGDYYYTLSKTGGTDPTTFTEATIGEPESFDPALDYENFGIYLMMNTYETLVFYDRESPISFVPQLAESWEISDDGLTYTFHIREGVTFHEGGTLTPSDVAYSLQRGMLQGGTASPQWLYYEAMFGVDTFTECGYPDISCLVDPTGAMMDDRETLATADPAALVAACEAVQGAVVADDAAGTVTLNLTQPWGPMIATLAQAWGSAMDREWVIENGGWDGSCDTWQDYYAMTAEEDPFKTIINGTGPFMLDHWTPGEEIVLVRNPNYWRTAEVGPAWEGGPTGPAALERVVVLLVDEWGTRFAMLQAGDADHVNVPPENRPQVDPLVGETCVYDLATAGFTCEETGDGFRMFRGLPQVSRTDVFFNFDIRR
jgi:ABC-type transport system substrate-binding protein